MWPGTEQFRALDAAVGSRRLRNASLILMGDFDGLGKNLKNHLIF
jgi:hypothetical protein